MKMNHNNSLETCSKKMESRTPPCAGVWCVLLLDFQGGNDLPYEKEVKNVALWSKVSRRGGEGDTQRWQGWPLPWSSQELVFDGL